MCPTVLLYFFDLITVTGGIATALPLASSEGNGVVKTDVLVEGAVPILLVFVSDCALT